MDFLTRYKKLLIIIGFILIVLILGYLIYSMFFKQLTGNNLPIDNNNKTASTTAGLPSANKSNGVTGTTTAGQKALPNGQNQNPGQTTSLITANQPVETEQITDSPVLGTTYNNIGGNIQYYNQTDGKFYKIDKNGNTTALSDRVFHAVDKVTWSSNNNKAILEYPDSSKIIYDFNTQKQVTLPKYWKDFNFEPNGNSIVLKSIGLDSNNRWLGTVNDDGTNFKAIESLGDKDATVYPYWSPNKQTIAMFTEGIDFNSQNLYFVGLNHENFKSAVIEGRGFEPKWSPNGQQLVYSVYSTDTDSKPSLWVTNAQGDSIGANRRSLDVQTFADKCYFSDGNDLFCAVPESLPEGAGLMPSLANDTKDNLYKIDISTGMKKLIAVPDGSFTMSSIIVSPDEKNLYFTDLHTNLVHKINLSK
jgi:hypothetical protein